MGLPKTTNVECFSHPEVYGNDPLVQSELISQSGMPFAPNWLAETIPVVTEFVDDEELECFGLVQTTPTHARSFEFAVPSSGAPNRLVAVWADEYGNRFTSLNTKGNNNSQQRIMSSLTAPSGYIPYGLQEDDALLRVLKASRLMREAGIDTEWVTRVVEPKLIKFGDEFVNQNSYKRLLAEKVTTEFMTNVSASDEHYDEGLDELRKATKALKNMTFFITTRAMRTPERIGDFFHDENTEQITARLGQIFQAYNLTTKPGEELDISKSEDIAFYFTELLPKLAASNLAKLHNIGLKHTFPVTGNMNALGGLVDLDSVAGIPLGFGTQEPIDTDDCVDDITILLSDPDREMDMEGLFHNLRVFEFDLCKNPYDRFCNNYVSAYLSERHFSDDPDCNALEAAYLVCNLNYCQNNIDDEYVHKVAKLYFADVTQAFQDRIRFNNDEERHNTVLDRSESNAERKLQGELIDNFELPLTDADIESALDKAIQQITTIDHIANLLREASYEWADFPDYSCVEDVQKTLCQYFPAEQAEVMTEALMWPVVRAIDDEYFRTEAAKVDIAELSNQLRSYLREGYISKIDTTVIPTQVTGDIRRKLQTSVTGEMLNNAHILATCSSVSLDDAKQITDNLVVINREQITETLTLGYPEKSPEEQLRVMISDGNFDGFSISMFAENKSFFEAEKDLRGGPDYTYIAYLFESPDRQLRLVVYSRD